MRLVSLRSVFWGFVVFLIVYSSVYFVLSRRGMAETTKYGMKQFAYCRVEGLLSSDPEVRRSAVDFHNSCFVLFVPLNYLEFEMGTGMKAAYPLPKQT